MYICCQDIQHILGVSVMSECAWLRVRWSCVRVLPQTQTLCSPNKLNVLSWLLPYMINRVYSISIVIPHILAVV